MRITATLVIEIKPIEGVTEEEIRDLLASALADVDFDSSLKDHLADLEVWIGDGIATSIDTGDHPIEVTCSLEIDS